MVPTCSCQISNRCPTPTDDHPRCGRHGPACNAAETIGVDVQQEELTNAEDSIEWNWPLHCHHTNQTHVLHWHHQHPKRGGGGKENCGFCCHLAWQKPRWIAFYKIPEIWRVLHFSSMNMTWVHPGHPVIQWRLKNEQLIGPLEHCFSLPHSFCIAVAISRCCIVTYIYILVF